MTHYDLVVYRTEEKELTLDRLAQSAGVHPELVQRYKQFGLLQPVREEGERCWFQTSDIRRLGVINRLRGELGINLPGVAVVLDMLERLRALEQEAKSLRARL